MPPKNSVWNYNKDGITQSFIKKFMECKLQCNLEYIEGWTKKEESIWFRYGHLVHYLIEESYKLGRGLSDIECIDISNAYIGGKGWLDDNGNPKNDEITLAINLAISILPTYFKVNFADYLENTIDQEIELRMPFFNTFVRGIVDRVYWDKMGNLILMDHKTTSRTFSNIDELRDEYRIDTQTMLYLAMARYNYGTMPYAMVYNLIRTPATKYSRKKKDEDNVTFLSKIATEFSRAPSEYLKRIDLMIMEEELDDWLKTKLAFVVKEINDWWENGCPPYPFNEQSLRTKFNSRCLMYDLIVHGREVGYKKRQVAYTEY